MAEEKKLSPFALVLTDILDKTGLYSRKQWAFHLNVRESSISQWVNDQTKPRSRTLWLIVQTLREHEIKNKEPLQAFEELVDKPSIRVSPHGRRMGATIGHYMLKAKREDFEELLSTLPTTEQEEALKLAVKECKRLRERADKQPTSLFRLSKSETEITMGAKAIEEALLDNENLYDWASKEELVAAYPDPLEAMA